MNVPVHRSDAQQSDNLEDAQQFYEASRQREGAQQ